MESYKIIGAQQAKLSKKMHGMESLKITGAQQAKLPRKKGDNLYTYFIAFVHLLVIRYIIHLITLHSKLKQAPAVVPSGIRYQLI